MPRQLQRRPIWSLLYGVLPERQLMQSTLLHSQRNSPSSLPNPLRISKIRSFLHLCSREWWDLPVVCLGVSMLPKRARSRPSAPNTASFLRERSMIRSRSTQPDRSAGSSRLMREEPRPAARLVRPRRWTP